MLVPTYSLSGLVVSGLETNLFYKLSEVLTQKEMRVSTDNIVTEGDLARGPERAIKREHQVLGDGGKFCNT